MRETVAVACLVAAAICPPSVLVSSGRDRITLSLAAIYPSPGPFPKEGGPRPVRDPGALRYGSMSWRRVRLAAEYGLCLDRPVTPVS